MSNNRPAQTLETDTHSRPGPRADGSRRGRPTRKEAEAIGRRMLDAARGCLLEVGFDNATMEMVAQRAGVTKMTLYLRYPDKIGLMRAVVKDYVAALSLEASQADWLSGATLDERLRTYARSLLRWRQEAEVRALRKLVMGSWGVADALSKDLRKLVQTPMLDQLAADFAACGAREGDAVAMPRQVAALFLGMLAGAEGALPDEPDSPTVDAYADLVVDVLLKGRTAW